MTPLLEIREVSKTFGGVRAVSGVSFSVTEGETVGLLGPNGAGKTTLFGMISGFIAPDAGSIRLGGEEINRLQPHEICRRGVARTFQLVQPFPSLTVIENVTIGALLHCKDAKEARRSAQHILERVGLAERSDVRASDLTGADQRRMELAKSLATRPRLILADEVLTGLTPSEQDSAIALIRDLQAEGIAFVLIEHVIGAVAELCPRVIVLHHGVQIAEGSVPELAENTTVVEAYLGERLGAA